MFAAMSITTALYGVKQGCGGKYIDCSMMDCLVSWMGGLLKSTEKLETIVQDYGYDVYKTKDNKFITLSMVNEDHFWRNLCSAINRTDLADISMQERAKRTDELAAILRETILGKTRDEWVEILEKADVPSGPVYTRLEELFNDPQILARQMLLEIDEPGKGKTVAIDAPIKYMDISERRKRKIPALGEHSAEILSRLLGMKDEEIQKLKESQVI